MNCCIHALALFISFFLYMLSLRTRMDKNHLTRVMKSGLHLAHHGKQDCMTTKRHHLLSHFILQNGVLEEYQLGGRIMNILLRASTGMVLQVSSKLMFFAPIAVVAKSPNIILALQLIRYRMHISFQFIQLSMFSSEPLSTNKSVQLIVT